MKNVTYVLGLILFSSFMLSSCSKEEISTSTSDELVTIRRKEVPLKGSLTFTTVSRTVGFPATEVFEGGGNINHLGRVTVTVTQHIPNPNSGFYGTMEITAANGDQLFLSYSGGLTNFNPQISLAFTSEIDFEVTGGSGRFSDAAGSGKGYGSGVFPQFPPVDPLTVRVFLSGMISY